MSLIVKIMCANRGNDSHPRHGHRLFADVKEVDLIEPTELRGPQLSIVFRRTSQAEPEDRRVLNLYGNVYIMNEAGKTISSFDVSNSGQLGMPAEAFGDWDRIQGHDTRPPGPGDQDFHRYDGFEKLNVRED